MAWTLPQNDVTAGETGHLSDHDVIYTDLVATLASTLVPTGVKTANYSASVNDYVPVNLSSGNVTVTLPNAPADRTTVGVKIVSTNSTATNTLTVNTAGSDVFNVAGGNTTSSLTLQSQGQMYQYAASPNIWYVVADDLPFGQIKNQFPNWFNVKAFGATGNGTTDDTAAIQAAINAAIAARPSQPSASQTSAVVYLPLGNYLISSPLTFTSTISMKGDGFGSRIFTNASGIIDFSDTFLYAFQISDLTLDATGGDIFANANMHRGWFDNLQTIQRSPNYHTFVLDTAVNNTGISTWHFTRILSYTYPDPTTYLRTVPSWSFYCAHSQSVDVVHFMNCVFINEAINANYDNTQYVVDIACTASGGDLDRVSFINSDFGSCYGGAIRILSVAGILMEQVGCGGANEASGAATTVASGSNSGEISAVASWSHPSAGVLDVASATQFPPGGGTFTVATSSGTAVCTYTGTTGTSLTGCAYVSGSATGTVSTSGAVTFKNTLGNSLVYLGEYSGSDPCQSAVITGFLRESGSYVTQGQDPSDIEMDATCLNTTIINPAATQASEGIQINNNGAAGTTIIGPQAGLNTWYLLNPAGDTAVIGNGDIQMGGGSVIANTTAPTDSGMLAWNFDPNNAQTSGSSMVSETIYALRIDVKKITTVGHVWYYVFSAGSGATTGDSFVGLYSASGTQIALTEIDSYVTSSGTVKIPLTANGGQTLTLVPGSYFVFLLITASGMPSVMRGSGGASQFGIGGVSGNYRCAAYGTSSVTVLPSPATMSNLTQTNSFPFWVALAA